MYDLVVPGARRFGQDAISSSRMAIGSGPENAFVVNKRFVLDEN